MSNKFLSTTSAFLLSTSMLVADVPKVTVDIAPVHSLVSKVMNGVGKPDLIIPAGASPHEYQLKPSNAQSLEDADIVFWICLLYTSPSPRDATLSRMPSSA